MKKLSNVKKNKVVKKKKERSKGFTLVELLATIAVLSLVLTIVIYFALNIINNSKIKSYETTINNVQSTANTYVMEDGSRISWVNGITDLYQYQCITVQNLIDKGYFKGDVLDSYVNNNIRLKATDYIYIERNKDSKTITKNILLVNEREGYVVGLCGNLSTVGNINFIVEPVGWSKEKDITIQYDIYGNNDKASNYRYDYVYGEISLDKKFSNLSMVESLTVDNNGTLKATIIDKNDKTIASNSLVISKIDNELPVVSIESTNNAADYQTATLNMSDNAGVSSYYFGKQDPSVNNVEWISVDGDTNVQKSARVDSSGIWYLGVKDIVGNTTIISKEFYKTILSIDVDKATVTPNTIITMEGNTLSIPNVAEKPYYTFAGWYTSSNYSGSAITTYKPVNDSTLYGKTVENKLTGGSVKIAGTNTYGETLTATITEDTTPKADKYSYQWYYNSSNSTTGGTAIDGATKSTYKPNSKAYDKYVYVVVTAEKDNYRSTTFSDITDASTNTTPKVAKRKITVTAVSSSKVYDGSALTDSTCTLTSGTYAFEQTITSCTMTSASTITNVGSVDNVIDSVTMSSGKSYYDITTVDGTLTVSKKSLSLGTHSATYNGTTSYSRTFSTGVGSETLKLTYNPYSKNAGSYTYATSAASGKYTVTMANGTGKASNYSIGSGGTFTINKANPTMTVTPSTLSLDLPNTGTITYTYNGDGSVSCSSTNTAVATCSINTSTKKVIVTSLAEGSTTIKISAAAGNNYNSTSKSVTVTVVNPVVTVDKVGYNCPVYETVKRTAIYHITTCTGGVCNFDMLNGFDNTYTGFDKDVNYPISWTVSQDTLSYEFGDTMYNNCDGKKLYINATTMNCRSAPDMDNSTVLKTFNACVRVKAVRTTHKVNSSYDWFYSTTYGCFMTGRYLTTSVPSSCSGSSSDTETDTGTGTSSCLSGWNTLTDEYGASYCCPEGVTDPHNTNGQYCLYIGG